MDECSEGCRGCTFSKECNFKKFVNYFRKLSDEKFHGNLIIPFKDGKIGKVKKEEIVDLENY